MDGSHFPDPNAHPTHGRLGDVTDFSAAAGPALVWLIAAGGIAYTLGAVVYGFKRPNPSPRWFGFHEIFHVGTVVGFVCHLIAVFIAVTT